MFPSYSQVERDLNKSVVPWRVRVTMPYVSRAKLLLVLVLLRQLMLHKHNSHQTRNTRLLISTPSFNHFCILHTRFFNYISLRSVWLNHLVAVLEIDRVNVEGLDHLGRISNPHRRAVEVHQHPIRKGTIKRPAVLTGTQDIFLCLVNRTKVIIWKSNPFYAIAYKLLPVNNQCYSN